MRTSLELDPDTSSLATQEYSLNHRGRPIITLFDCNMFFIVIQGTFTASSEVAARYVAVVIDGAASPLLGFGGLAFP